MKSVQLLTAVVVSLTAGSVDAQVSPRRLHSREAVQPLLLNAAHQNYAATHAAIPEFRFDDEATGGVSQREKHGLIGGAIGFVIGAVATHIAFRDVPGGCDATTGPCNYAANRRNAWWGKTAVGGVVGFSIGAVIGALMPHDSPASASKQTPSN